MGIIKKVVGSVAKAIGLGPSESSGQVGTASGADTKVVQQANEAQVKAQEEANRIAAEQAQHQQELNNINKNYAADLTNENRAMVETSGAANESATLMNDDQKKRKPTAGLASTLGINV
ncbi:virion structural protein [Ralstonia phage RSB3]|uniref:Uncharacterized protein n=1 Tax=Ralstonia phage RSB3 TaxID=1402875 RepID=U3TM36_9CAUD|nr:virion structural protein [Ralstonia phage RSB3]BAN92344.1 hypothetical protein [Ralstonia phage RSB3]